MLKLLDVKIDDYVDAELVNSDEFKPFGKHVAAGKPIVSHEFPLMIILIQNEPKDIFKSGIWTIVSAKFIETLHKLKAGDCFQYFDTDVRFKNGNSAGKYYFLHIVRRIDCFDEAKSSYEMKNGWYFNVKKLEIIHESVSDEDLVFRVDNLGRALLILNSLSLEFFQRSDLKGIDYFSLDEWNNRYKIGSTQ